VSRSNHLWNGGHTYKIRADSAQVSYLSWSFVARAGQRGVDPFIESDVAAVSLANGYLAKSAVIGNGHVREARAKTLVVWSRERIGALKIYVVFDHYELALDEFAFDAAGRIREDYGSYAHAREDAHGECDVFGRVAFVEVDAALHSGDRDVPDSADNELAGVADGRGARVVGNFGVRDFGGAFEFVGESTQARAED
jgi:hypothetical protein